MASNSDFESEFFNPFLVNEELQSNQLDHDVNYYLNEISSLDILNTMYLMRSRTD